MRARYYFTSECIFYVEILIQIEGIEICDWVDISEHFHT